MFNRREQKWHEEKEYNLTTKSTKIHEKNQRNESADICVPRNNPLTCLLLFRSFLYSFRVFLCVSWLEMDFFVSLRLCAR